MSAIQSSLSICEKVLFHVENRINEHFKQENETTNTITILSIHELAGNIALQLNIKQSEVLQLIHVYLQQKPNLTIKHDKITRASAKSEKSNMTVQECALRFYDLVKDCAPTIINNSFLIAENNLKERGLADIKVKLGVRDLCNEISTKLNIKWYAAYHCFKKYIDKERKDLVITRGQHGGLERRTFKD